MFHKEAESQGRWARLQGFSMDSPAVNPYVKNRGGWMYRSFCAGWSDVDADPDAPKEPIRDDGTLRKGGSKKGD